MGIQSLDRRYARELRTALAWMYAQGWASGTGGGLCIRRDGVTYYAPSGVHKELVREDEVFVSIGDRCTSVAELEGGRSSEGKITECRPIFDLILDGKDTGAVLHTHATLAVLAANFLRNRDIPAEAREDRNILTQAKTRKGWFVVEKLEMLKGLTGYGYNSVYTVPIVANTPREMELTAEVGLVFRWGDLCVLIEDHGAYIWGTSWDQCKRHAEVLHWLFEYEYRKAALGA